MRKNEKKITLFIPAIVTIIIVLFVMLILGFSPFGTKDIFCFSGSERVASYYFELWDNVHNGRFFFFSTKSGVGYDFSTVITTYLTNPLALIYLILPRESLFIFHNILFLLECGLAGGSFCYYIVLHNLLYDKNMDTRYNKFLMVAMSVVYALSSVFIDSQINSISILVVFAFPFLILGLDKMIKGDSAIMYIISAIVTISIDYKIAVIVLIFSNIYLFVLSFKLFKETFKTLLQKLLYDGLCAGVASLFWLNNYKSVFFNKKFNLDLKYCYLIDNKYRMLFFVLCFSFLSVINLFFKGKDCEKNSNSKFSQIYKIVAAVLVVLYFCGIISGLLYYRDRVLVYEDTLIGRTDKALDIILEEKPTARVFVYGIDGEYTTPISNLILDYDYVLIPDNKTNPDNSLEFVDSVSNIDIYRVDQLSDSFDKINGLSASSSIFDSELKVDYPYDKANDIATELTGVDDVFVRVDDDIKVTNDLDDPANYNKTVISFSFEKPGDYYTNIMNTIHLGELMPEDRVELKCDCPNEELKRLLDKRESVYFDKDVYKNFQERLSENTRSISVEGDSLTVESFGGEDYLIVPLDISNCFVDSKGREIVKEFYYFEDRIAYIEGMDLDCNIVYNPIWLKKGTLFSIISLLLLIIFLLVTKRLKQKGSRHVFDENRFVEIIYNNRIYFYVLMLNLIFIVAAFIYLECIPFGKDSFVCSDGYIISYPVIRGIVNDIKNNSFTQPDYSIGGCWDGMSSVSVIVTFLNPLKWILFLMKKDNSLFIYNIYYVFNYLLIGPSLIYYLVNRPYGSKMKKTELKLIPISLAYSLSSFVVVYYSFSEFLEFAYLIPIIVLGLERLVYEKKCILYSLSLTLLMISSTYYAFILCELLLLYFFVLEYKTIKSFLISGVRFAICSICSALMSIFSLAPFYLNAMNCGYNETDSKAFTQIRYLSQTILDSIRDVDMSYEPVIITGVWSHANAYCGMVIFTMAPLILIIGDGSLRYRVKRFLLMMLLYVAFGNEFLNYILHGFHFQSLVPNRFACFYLFLIITFFYELLLHYKDLFQSKGVLSFSATSGAFLVALLYINDFSSMKCLKTAVFVIAYLVILLLGYKNKNKYKFIKIILLVLMLELVVSAVNALSSRTPSRVISENTIRVINSYAEEINKDKDILLRTEILTSENYNSGKMVDNNSVSLLSSIIKTEESRMVNAYCIDNNSNNINYGVGNPLSNLFLNVKYYEAEGRGDSVEAPHYFELMNNEENVLLYQDPYVSKAGIILPYEFELSDDKESSVDYQNDICKSLVQAELYEVVESGIDVSKTNDGLTIKTSIPEEVIGDIYFSDDKIINYIGYSKYGEKFDYGVSIRREDFDKYKECVKIAILNEETLEKLSQYVKTHSLSDYYLDRDKNEIIAHYDSEKDGKLMLPIPAYKNWQVKIDGAATSFDNSAGGLTIPVPAGKHEVTVKYIPESNLPYYIISLVSFIIFMVSMYIYNKKLKKQENVEESTNEEIVESVSE